MDTASSLAFRHGRRLRMLLGWAALAWLVLLLLASVASSLAGTGTGPSPDGPALAPFRWEPSGPGPGLA
jgi:hypothetical protein